MDRTLISWNFPNWITIMLMAAGGYAILAVAKQLFVRGGARTVAGGGGF
jgi:hypothetical protein